jgi:hypothetical protein
MKQQTEERNKKLVVGQTSGAETSLSAIPSIPPFSNLFFV